MVKNQSKIRVTTSRAAQIPLVSYALNAMLAVQIFALLTGLGAASASNNANSDVCVTASAYDGTAASPVSGCPAGTTG